MAKIYAVISGKGGVGKTTSTINLGMCLNHLGEDVIVVDGNLTTPNVGIHLGAPIVPVNLNHVLLGKAKLEDAIYEHESGTKIMPASLSLQDTEKIHYKKFGDVMKRLRKVTNHVLIDSAAGLGEEARAAINASDEIIIVTNPEMAAVTDALKTIKLAEDVNKPVIGVIVARHRGGKTDMTYENILDMLEVPILGVIPEDDSVRISQAMKNAVVFTHPRSRAAQGYIRTSRRLLGEEVQEESLGLFGRMLRGLGLK